jgi:hypothetical protein
MAYGLGINTSLGFQNISALTEGIPTILQVETIDASIGATFGSPRYSANPYYRDFHCSFYLYPAGTTNCGGGGGATYHQARSGTISNSNGLKPGLDIFDTTNSNHEILVSTNSPTQTNRTIKTTDSNGNYPIGFCHGIEYEWDNTNKIFSWEVPYTHFGGAYNTDDVLHYQGQQAEYTVLFIEYTV